MRIFQILLLGLILHSLINTNSDDTPDFVPPLKIPISVSANFGELRIDHFHSGLDIRTQGVTGQEVLAAASGYVYRISVSPGGFGKALYIRHPSGYSTVYGHLDRFIPEIEEYVISRQYEEKSYMVNLWPPRDRFKFNQGDVIAYSGNSGSSTGPHLHYEIRRSEQEIPVNPLLFDIGIKDNIRPVIEMLAIYPVDRNTLINNTNKVLMIKASGNNGKYIIPSSNPVRIHGRAGFGLKSYDLQNGTSSRSSVYSIELKIDSAPVFHYKMDSFSFDESRYVNCHIDYATYLKENKYFERAYLLPNDKLSAYSSVINRGIYNFTDGKKHLIELILTDVFSNMSSLTFYAEAVPDAPEVKMEDHENKFVVMPYNRNNKFTSRDVIVNIPSGTLYDTLFFDFGKSPGNSSTYSEIFQIHNRLTPVHKPYNLYIKPDRIEPGKKSKMLIVQLTEDNQKIAVGGRWENDYLTANPASFGNFYIGIDTTPPIISANGLRNGPDLSGRSEIRIKISDTFSGIKSYNPKIDNKWALFEYDQKNDMLIYRFDPGRIEKGKKHDLSLSVTDNRDNVSTLETQFLW